MDYLLSVFIRKSFLESTNFCLMKIVFRCLVVCIELIIKLEALVLPSTLKKKEEKKKEKGKKEKGGEKRISINRCCFLRRGKKFLLV